MRSLVLALAGVAVLAGSALAEPQKVVVLHTEGRADAATRAKIDASLVRLASSSGAQVSPGDITFTDAAAAAGCAREEQRCRDEIVDMLGVDEVVYATITAKPGGSSVEVHRVTRGSTRSAVTTTDLAGAASLFAPPPAPRVDPPPPIVEPPPAEPTPVEPAPEPTPAPIEPARAPAPMTGLVQVDAAPRRSSRLHIAGMAGGGALVLLGFVLWGKASSIQDDIDAAPTLTRSQIDRLMELEERGDGYAGLGNILFLGGVVLGGVSTYYFVKARRARPTATTARVTPTMFDGGAGLVLTIGGAR